MNFLRTAVSAVTSNVESAKYEVTNTQENYEERQYPQTHWVSTKVKAMYHKEAVSTGFRRLFRYIQGDNDKKVQIPMTTPVATKVEPGAGPNCESTFTVSFYIGEEFQQDTPTPTSQDVYIDRWPPVKIYSRQFGGFADQDSWISNARELGESLPPATPHHSDWYFTAGYDSPFKLFNRKNEVWFVASDKEEGS